MIAALHIVSDITGIGSVYAFVRMLPKCREFMRGKIVSRNVIRISSFGGAWALRMLLATAGIAMSLAGVAHTAQLIISIVVNVWMIDDWLTGRDDRRKRLKDLLARVKLRMPKPVKLRRVERWKPVPA